MQTVALMAFCIETQTLKGILTAFCLVWTGEILPAGAGQGEEDFHAEKCTCVNLAFIAFYVGALHLLSCLLSVLICFNRTCFQS